MDDLLVVALAGFLASMVDGALGMGFGPTSSSVLLSIGVAPAAVSATVNIAKVATGVVAAVAHWRFENIDHRLVVRLAVPGAVGAVIGATVVTTVDSDAIRPVLAVLLLAVGLRILMRFSGPLGVVAAPDDDSDDPVEAPVFDARGVELAASAGGITNGLVGAWGPVVTPYLLHRGLAARFAVGSVNTAEVAVAAVASVSILGSLGGAGIERGVLVAMLLGGVAAAPLAAWSVRFVPARVLGLAVGGLLLATQTRELAIWFDLGAVRWIVYAAVALLVAAAAARSRLAARQRVPAQPPTEPR